MPFARRTTLRALIPALVALAVGAGACSVASGDEVSTTGPEPTTEAVTATEATTTESTTTTSTTTTTTEPPTTTTTAPVDPTTVPEEGVLKAGSVGSRTKAVQEALAAQHYDPGPADGKFGTRTTQAVWAFQALHGLAKDGVVGPETEAAILAAGPQQMLRPELGPSHTEVDLTRQVLIVWRDGQPALITHISSGSEVPFCETTEEFGEECGDAVTPVGVWRYERRIDGWREAPLGKLYKPVYFAPGGIAVHGANSVPAHPASHGCVRIPMAVAEYFPSLVANGDTIEVFRS